MPLDLSQLITNINRLMYNIDQKDQKYYDVFFSNTAQDVVIPKMNLQGQIEQITIKNYAKLNQEFQAWREQTVNDVRGSYRVWMFYNDGGF